MLNEASMQGEFDCLVLVAPAHGSATCIRRWMHPRSGKSLLQLQKDLVKVPDADLPEHLAGC